MRHLLTTLFLLCALSYMYAQDNEYDDDIVVLSLVESDGADVICNLLKDSEHLQDAINALMKEGRYIKSIVNTRFGILAVHEPNTKNLPQLFSIIPSYEFEKKIKKHFKEKWSIHYYNWQRGYALFDKIPEITHQSFEEIKVWNKGYNKKISKLNTKGEYLTMIGPGDFYAQNGHGNDIEQYYKSFIGKPHEIQDSISKVIDEGWIVSGASKFFNRYGNNNYMHVIFDRPKRTQTKQKILVLSTKGGVDAFTNNIAEGYRIDNIWCGWENTNYSAVDAAIERYHNSSSADWLDIIGGITSSASQLFGGNSNSSSSTVDGSDETYDSSGAGSSNASRKKGTSKSNHANWRSLEQSYSNYESQLIRMSNSSNIDKQEVRSIQRKMRDIREKIRVQSGGHQRAVSQWENWNP